MSEQKGFPFIRTPEQKEAHKAYLKSLKGEQGEQDELLLTPKEIRKTSPTGSWYVGCVQCAERVAEAQRAKQHNRFKKALEQSRKGEPLDLSEEEFELFSAIQNNGIAKHSHQNTLKKGK